MFKPNDSWVLIAPLAMSLIALLGGMTVRADVLFDNPATSTIASGVSDTAGDSLVINGHASPIDMVVASFALDQASMVTSVQFIGSYGYDNAPTAADAFLVNFYADNGGTPGALLSTQSLSDITRTSLAPPPQGLIYNPNGSANNYQGTLSLVQDLAPGSYFFGLSEVGSPSPGNWEWNGSSTGTFYILDSSSSIYDITVGGAPNDGLAFELDGTAVPEPSTYAYGIITVLVILLRSLWKRRRSAKA